MVQYGTGDPVPSGRRKTVSRGYVAPAPRTGPKRASSAERDMRMRFQADLMGQYDAGKVNGNGSGGYSAAQWDQNIPNGNAANDLFQVPPPASPNGPGAGGGGGGGRGSAPSTAQIQAYRDLLASYNNAPLMAEYDRQDAATRALYDPAKVNARWDAAGTGVTGAVGAGNDRLAGILAELQAKAVQARTGVNDAYAGGDTRLQEIQSRFMGQNQAGQADVNSVLGAFGAGQVAGGPEAAALQRLFAQGQITNNGARTVADAAQASLPGAYAGLGADVSQGMTRDQTALMQQIATRRAAEQQANDAALNQMLGQTGLARIQAQQEAAAAQAKLRAELASLGIAV
jgi:hypothetical protein